MIKSMTGFGRSETIINDKHIIIEIKTVNHRYFELNTHISHEYSFIEPELKKILMQKVTRGKIELYVQIENINDNSTTISINLPLAKSYYDAFTILSQELKIKNDITLSKIADYPDVLTVNKQENNEDDIICDVKIQMEKAVDQLVNMRIEEGKKLSSDFLQKANEMKKTVEEIDKLSPETVKAYREHLYKILSDIIAEKNIEDSRILTESAIFADKVAVDEETVRLNSHISQFTSMLSSNKPVGRQMDFLVQEMNREANTIGSKASDVKITKLVIELKSQIERIREQVQNIE